MPTVFETLTDKFYAAFFQPDPDRRKEAIESWIKESTPVIQSAIESDLRAYIDDVLKDTWTPKGWKNRAQKFYGLSQQHPFIDTYKLYLDVKLRTHTSRDTDIIIGTLTTEVRAKTNDTIEAAKWVIAKMEPPAPIAIREIDIHGNNVEQAILIIEKFLNECYRDNVHRVRIIHGKGIFVLQKAIREYLGKHKVVKSGSISPADKDHGGEGATEANLIEFSMNE